MLFDTHAHYDAEQFDADRHALLSSMPSLGVELIVNPGCDLPSSRAALALAEELNLPVIIHEREAHADALAIVKEFPKVKGVFHCYSGSAEFAKEILKCGYMISFTGVVTFKNARKAAEAVEVIPLERLMIETDAPYMAPVPHRGKRNQSDYTLFIAQKIAEIKGLTTEEVIAATGENGKRFFNIP